MIYKIRNFNTRKKREIMEKGKYVTFLLINYVQTKEPTKILCLNYCGEVFRK